MNKLLFLLVITSVACSNEKHKSKVDSEQDGPSLISWSHEYVCYRNHDDFSYYEDHENVIREYYSVEYGDKQITATTLMEVNCIDSITARIEVSNDTIYLMEDIIMTDDRVCSELHKFTFVISNPNNTRYTIISTK